MGGEVESMKLKEVGHKCSMDAKQNVVCPESLGGAFTLHRKPISSHWLIIM